MQYNGKVVYDDVYSWGKKNWANFAYEIDPPEEVTVFQEYVVYDAIGIIGSVGGTLGMFIGFSFTGFISSLINGLSKFAKSKIAKVDMPRIKPIQVEPNLYAIDYKEVKEQVEGLTKKFEMILERVESFEEVAYCKRHPNKNF